MAAIIRKIFTLLSDLPARDKTFIVTHIMQAGAVIIAILKAWKVL